MKVAPEDLRFEDGIFSSQKTNQTMGIPGELKNPKLRAAYEATAKA